MAGEQEPDDPDRLKRVLLAKARLMAVTLSKTIEMCESALIAAVKKMKKSRQVRLGGQIVTTVGSSGVLGALGATQIRLAAISGVVALVGSLASVAAEYFEQVANPTGGKLNVIYIEIAGARDKADSLLKTLQIYIEEKLTDVDLERCLGEANALCEKVSSQVYQIIESVVGPRLAKV